MSGQDYVGGLVGYATGSTIINSYATGLVDSAAICTGGFVGFDDESNSFTNNWWYNAVNTVDIGDDGNVNDAWVAKAVNAEAFFNPGHAVYDPYNAGGNRWGFGGGSNADWVTVVDNDGKTASFPILSWQAGAVTMAGVGTRDSAMIYFLSPYEKVPVIVGVGVVAAIIRYFLPGLLGLFFLNPFIIRGKSR